MNQKQQAFVMAYLSSNDKAEAYMTAIENDIAIIALTQCSIAVLPYYPINLLPY